MSDDVCVCVRVRDNSLILWCPGCEDVHRVTVGGADTWKWDGDPDSPTISPSILVTGVQWSREDAFYKPRHVGAPNTGDQIRCHSYVRAGHWQFLTDCTHDLAGQTVPLPPLPDYLTADAADRAEG